LSKNHTIPEIFTVKSWNYHNWAAIEVF